MPRVRTLNRYLLFPVLTILISGVASILARSVVDPARRPVVGLAATIDLTATVTFLYYWLLVRPGLRGKATMIFIALLGLWRAAVLFPDVVPGKVWIGGALELAIFGAVGAALWKSRGTSPDADPVERLRTAFSKLVPVAGAARVMASECAVFYYGFANWRARPHAPEGSRAFTMHKETMAADLMFSMALISLLEIVPVHLFAAHWSRAAAWTLTAFSFYGAIWMMALGRAFTLRPTLVDADGLTIRYGLLFSLRIPLDRIRAIRAASEAPESATAESATVVPRNTTPSLYLEFTGPLEAEIVLGLRRRVTSIGLRMDDATGFESALKATLARSR